MIGRQKFDEIRQRAKACAAREAVYDQVSDFALKQAKASLDANQLDISDAWTTIATFCMNKISDELKYLQDLRRELDT